MRVRTGPRPSLRVQVQELLRPVHGPEVQGRLSHRIRHELWERVRAKLWGDSFWSDGYFYRSVGSTTAQAVQFYVQNSQRKHWMRYDD